MEKTDNTNIKFCGSCDKKVYKATSKKSFDSLAKQNKWVAYFTGKFNFPTTLGVVAESVFNKKI